MATSLLLDTSMLRADIEEFSVMGPQGLGPLGSSHAVS